MYIYIYIYYLYVCIYRYIYMYIHIYIIIIIHLLANSITSCDASSMCNLMLVSLAFRSNFSLKHSCMSVLLFQLLCCVAAPSQSRLPASLKVAIYPRVLYNTNFQTEPMGCQQTFSKQTFSKPKLLEAKNKSTPKPFKANIFSKRTLLETKAFSPSPFQNPNRRFGSIPTWNDTEISLGYAVIGCHFWLKLEPETPAITAIPPKNQR